jgi:hypothetical protein
VDGGSKPLEIRGAWRTAASAVRLFGRRVSRGMRVTYLVITILAAAANGYAA